MEQKANRELKAAWRNFISVPGRNRQLQNQLLDVFLAKLISQYKDTPSSTCLT